MKTILKILLISIFAICPAFSLELNQFPPFKSPSALPYANIVEDVSPEIMDVFISPLKPTSTDSVSVRAKIMNNPKKTENVVISATLNYSIDNGETYERVVMERDEKDETIFVGKIPPQKEGTKVIFYLSAIDSVGNTATEVIDLKGLKSTAYEKALTLLSMDADEKRDIISDELDILETYITYDKDWIYLRMKTQDKITPGTTSNPPFLHSYGFGILNLDSGDDILGGYLLFYMPHLKLGGYPETVLYSLGQLDFIYKAEPSSEVKKNVIDLKFRRGFLGQNPSGKLKIVAGTCAITDINLRRGTGGISVIEYLQDAVLELRGTSSVTEEMVDKFLKYITPIDASPHTTVYLRSHSYTVGE